MWECKQTVGACRKEKGRGRVCDQGGEQMPVCLARLHFTKGAPGRNVFTDVCQGAGAV